MNRVVPPAELEATRPPSWPRRLASGPTKAIGVAKWLTNRALDVDRATAFSDEALAQELVNRSEDAQEGIASFVERRPPAFRGW